MRVPYRCSSCRTRNLFPRRIETYVRLKKCRACGHTRFYLDRGRLYRNDYCACEGYHHKHRIRSTFCIHNPQYEANVRIRRLGEHPHDVALDQLLASPPIYTNNPEPPF